MMYQRNDSMSEMTSKRQDYNNQSHCYTNPSFCQQSEYMPESQANGSGSSDLPPPPQFQVDDLPPPPDIQQAPPDYGQVNPAFHGSPEADLTTRAHHRHQSQQQQQPPQQQQVQHQRTLSNLNHTTTDRYCYIDESADQPSPPAIISHRRYGSLPLGNRAYAYPTNRYEYIQDDASLQLQVQCQPIRPHPQQQAPLLPQSQQQQQQVMTTVASAASRYEYIEQQQMQQRVCQQQPPPPPPPAAIQSQPLTPGAQTPVRSSVRSYRSADTHYTSLGPDAEEVQDPLWNEEDGQVWNTPRRQINTPKGRYTSIPMQEEYPPSLPERNSDASSHQRVSNVATQKLHEILTTPRKPRKRSQSEALSPIKTPQQQPNIAPIHRGGFTPGCSPSSATGHRAMNSPMRPQHHQQQQQQQTHQQSTPQSRALSPRRKGPMTSTPNKEPPSARRCLPLSEPANISAQPAMLRRHLEDSQAAAYGRSPSARQQQSSRYQPPDSAVEEAMYVEHKKAGFYQAHAEGVYVSRTAVVSPLSPPMSEANTTLVSSIDKYERKNAPLLLMLVGILTCGLAIYLSWSQERRYYYDSAVGCGAFCALAGASRSLRRTWSGLCLAGLCVVTCGGLLLLAAKTPRPGTPLHDVTAGALCGVSLLGAALAFLALLSPRCTLGRHHRVHSWIPSFAA